MLQVKLLHDLVEELAGEGTGRLAEILFKKKDVNEFLIAKKMELTINQVRNILYKLSADNLVSFVRKKDKRKGWYIYYWTLNTEKCLVKLEDSLNKKINYFENILKEREAKRFYICNCCDIEVTEEKALEDGFSCEECADIYELSDNSKPIREAKMWISKTKKNLELIQGELESVRKKKAATQRRVIKKLEREDAAKKALMKAARAAARKKVAHRSVGTKTRSANAKKVTKKVAKKVAHRSVGTKTRSANAKKVTKKVAKKVARKPSLASKLKKKVMGKR